MVHVCDVFGCLSREPVVKCFKWPEDKARRHVWEKFCQNPQLNKLKRHICAKHFHLKHFMDGSRSKALLRSTQPIPTLEPPPSTLAPLSHNSDEADLSQGNDDSDEEDVSCYVDPSDVAPSSPLPSTYFSKTAPRLSSSVFPSPPSCVYSYHYL